MENEKLVPQKSLEKLKEIMDSLDVRIDNTSLIQDNKIIFKFEDKLYRCRMPSQKDRAESEDRKNKCQIRLMAEGGYKNRKQLRQILKDNGTVDIELLESEKLKVQDDLKQIWLDLAVLHDENQEAIAKMKDKAQQIENKHYDICLEIANWLSPSLEDRIEKEYFEYLTFMCTEKLKNDGSDTWEPVWKNFSEFEADVTHLPNKSVVILTNLMLSLRG